MKLPSYLFGCIFLCLATTSAQENVQEIWTDFAAKQNLASSQEYQQCCQEGLAHFGKGSYREAAEVLTKATLASPYHPLPNFYLAISLFSLHQYEYAGQLLRRGVALYPEWKTLPLNFRKLFPVRSDFDNELQRLENWLFAERRPVDAHFLFALLCQFSGELRKAEMSYRIILKQEPFYQEATYFLGLIAGKNSTSWENLKAEGEKFIQLKQYGKAVATWVEACSQHPHEPEFLYHLGYSLAAADYLEQAGCVLRVAIRKTPHLLSKQIATQAQWLKKDAGWLTRIEERLQNQPQNTELLFLLSYLYAVIGEGKKALIASQHLQQLQQNHREIVELMKLWQQDTSSVFPPQGQTRDKNVKGETRLKEEGQK